MEWGLLPNTVALAAVAVLGYLFGRGGTTRAKADPNQMRRELRRSQTVVAELERIAAQIRQGLASHHTSVMLFKDHLSQYGDGDEAGTREIYHEAQRLLGPTMQLAGDMASAYDELRQHSSMLSSFAECRTDSLTGLSNRAALDEALPQLMATQRRYGTPLSVIQIEVDQRSEAGDDLVQQAALLLEQNVRETDIVARGGDSQFTIVLPQANLDAAAVLARRIRRKLEAEISSTAGIGLAVAHSEDSPTRLLAKAKEALAAAAAAGGNCIFQHSGNDVERVSATQFVRIDETEAVAEFNERAAIAEMIA